MRTAAIVFEVMALMISAGAATAHPDGANDVVWTTPGHDENDSMPIGNGDLAANVWTEQQGDLILLVAKSDAWTELNKLVKLGRIRLQLTPNPFVGGANYTQTLHLDDASVEIRSGTNSLQVWVDANHPVLHVSAKLDTPSTLRATLETWRDQSRPYDEPSPEKGGLFGLGQHSIPLQFGADNVLEAGSSQVSWLHFNDTSIFPIVLRQQHLESLAARDSDPLLHRAFGAALTGPGLVTVSDRVLQSNEPSREPRLDLTALTTTDTESREAWRSQLSLLLEKQQGVDRAAHQKWWRDFWDRSWIRVSGTTDADKVSQGFAIQRYMIAASSRGDFPVKYNGGLFTVGHDMPAGVDSTQESHNPDYRAWGGSYWNQNNRLLYWPLIATGDFDLIEPWFRMYMRALPLAKDRTRLYFHHEGAAFIETVDSWGLPNLNDFGWDNATTTVESRWMRYHTQGALEVLAQMLDVYDITQDAAFARGTLVPFAEGVVGYYDKHWATDSTGKMQMSPAQSLETYQLDAADPTPDIAALQHVLPRLLRLPAGLASTGLRGRWKNVLRRLPPIALGTTANGKIPPSAHGDPGGQRVILPARSYGASKNVENPELYTVFPYRLYGVGKPDLPLARSTFLARLFPQDTCWGQDGPQGAMLGLTDVAEAAAIHEFTNYGAQRFVWFWKPAHDWIPDLDNGGAGMITLESMLMQADGRRIQLLPAWPREWTADFKLHAAYRTTISGHVENGEVTNLQVSPQSRRKDVFF
jgi:alpha-L-fucosidase 2